MAVLSTPANAIVTIASVRVCVTANVPISTAIIFWPICDFTWLRLRVIARLWWASRRGICTRYTLVASSAGRDLCHKFTMILMDIVTLGYKTYRSTGGSLFAKRIFSQLRPCVPLVASRSISARCRVPWILAPLKFSPSTPLCHLHRQPCGFTNGRGFEEPLY